MHAGFWVLMRRVRNEQCSNFSASCSIQAECCWRCRVLWSKSLPGSKAARSRSSLPAMSRVDGYAYADAGEIRANRLVYIAAPGSSRSSHRWPGYLPADRCAPVHRRLVLLRVDGIGYVGVVDEALMASEYAFSSSTRSCSAAFTWGCVQSSSICRKLLYTRHKFSRKKEWVSASCIVPGMR